MITQEIQAANLANTMIALVAELQQIATAVTSCSNQWTNLSAANLLNAFPTAPLSSTGGIGSADGSPNTAHPINVTVSPGSEINRAISANNLASMLTYLQGVQSAINGSAVSANGAALQLLALCQ